MVVVGVVTARSSMVTACAWVAEADRNPVTPGLPGACSFAVESVARVLQVDGSVAPTHALPRRVVVPEPRRRSRTCNGVPATYFFTGVTAVPRLVWVPATVRLSDRRNDWSAASLRSSW